MASWAELNQAAGDSASSVPSAAQSGGWAAANARATQALGGAKQVSTLLQEQQMRNQAIETAAIASRSPSTTTPFLSNAVISAPPSSDSKFQILGVRINKPTSLYGTGSGRPVIDVEPSRFEVKTNENSNFIQRGVAAIANTVAQSVFSLSQAFGNAFNVMLVDNVTKGKDISLGADGTPTTEEGTPILLPDVRERLQQGRPAQPTLSEKIGAGLDIVTSAAGASFTPISAQLAAAEELPIIGKPIFGTVNKGFELLDHASRFVGGKVVDLLPVSDDSKAVLRRPLEDLAGIVGTLFGVKAIHLAGERGGGRVVDALPISEKTKGQIRGGVQLSAGVALDPFGTAYRGIVGSIKRKVTTRTTKGEEITPEVAQKIVNEVVKEVKMPEVQAIMEVPTREGKTRVYTNQKIILENLIRNREDLNYRRVDDLGISLETKQPITSRFTWDYAKQQGTIYTTDKTTAVDLAHELGHYVDRQLGAALNIRLSDVLPEYQANRDQVNQMLADYALDRLGGDATHADINAEIVKIADNIRQEVQSTQDQAERRRPAKEFAASVADIINDPLRRKQSPELAQLIEFSLGNEALRKGAKADVLGEPGSLAETKSILNSLEGTRREAIKRARAEDQTFAEQRLAEDVKRQSIIERGEIASENFDWRKISQALRDSKVFQKEGSLNDRTIDGVLMEKQGQFRVVAYEDVKKMQAQNWKSKFSMDSIAHANGFESAEQYATYIMGLDAEMRGIPRMSEQRAAHEYLLNNDPNYAKLTETIDTLRQQLTSAEDVIRAEATRSAENEGDVLGEKEKNIAQSVDYTGIPSNKIVEPSLPISGRDTNLSPSLTSTRLPSGAERSTEYVLPSQLNILADPSIYGTYTTMKKISQANVDPFSAAIKKATGITPDVRVKSQSSFEGKLERYKILGKDPKDISDVLASRVIVEAKDVNKQLENIKNDFDVVNIENYFENPSEFGYEGINIKVKLPNDMFAEIQIHTPNSVKAIPKIHKIYEKWRNKDMNKFSADEMDAFKKDVDISKSIVEAIKYDSAEKTDRITSFTGNESKINALYNDILQGKAAKQRKSGTSKVGESIARKVVEQKLEDSYKGTAEFERINIKDQARRVEELINGDLERAKRIMTGEEALLDGMRAGALIKGMEEYALRTGDAELAFELANSPLVAETSLYAQEMRLLAERSPDSATTRLQEVKKARQKAAEERLRKGETVDGNIKMTLKELQSEVKKSRPKREDWSSFIDAIKCK